MLIIVPEPKRIANLVKHEIDLAEFETGFSWGRYVTLPAHPSRTGRVRQMFIGAMGGRVVAAIVSRSDARRSRSSASDRPARKRGPPMTRTVDWTKAAHLPPAELDRLLDADHDEVDDNPPATDAQLAAARPGTRRPGQRGLGKKPAKVLLTMRIDPEVLSAWEASGEGWRGRIGELIARGAPRPKRR